MERSPKNTGAAGISNQSISRITATHEGRVFAGTNTTNYFNERDPALDLLPFAERAPFNAYGKGDLEPECHPGTRTEVLKLIRDWIDGKDQRHIFWLSGLAGSGKSTIARTIARQVYNTTKWSASFFFSHGDADIGNAKRIISTIARQLASKNPGYRKLVQELLMEDHEVIHRILTDQWQELVAGPISQLENEFSYSPLTIVIDGLDECEEDGGIEQMLQLITNTHRFDKLQLRLLLTSRPETHFRDCFHDLSPDVYKRFALQDVPHDIVNRDIRGFLQHRLSKTRLKDDVLSSLVSRASHSFIWASTACRFILGGKSFARERAKLILEDSDYPMTPQRELDEIYSRVLANAVSSDLEHENQALYTCFRRVIGSIVVLLTPLSLQSISNLLGSHETDISQMLEDLHSILEIPEDSSAPLRLHHPTFRDFLLDRKRCQDSNFHVEKNAAHKTLHEFCIQLMTRYLKQDICHLEDLGLTGAYITKSNLGSFIPPEVQYACLNWVTHLQMSHAQDRGYHEVERFLENHALHWIEALAWMQKIDHGIRMIEVLESFVPTCGTTYYLRSYLAPVKYFMQSNHRSFLLFPLTIYWFEPGW
ncbi:hypothetical protein BDV28DRAFT_147151 [Aspergillus coremiiformis]|uniref:NACHT domain-containing protein n=1 Tax=Aspergillus coremiiformis TaxID=138285 RepID=A0A5N6ZEA9_9EURO|nr:hypothetical protein BDV28DRAFT_147151 [Aspergillus coremiiformis]